MKRATCHPDKPHKGKGLCTVCYQRTHRKEYTAAWYQKNKERLIAKATARNKANPEAHRQATRRYYKKHRPKKLARIYKTSEEQMEQLLAIEHCQVCAIALATDTDHDHATGKVRGRLCTNCNNGLGRFKDNPALLRAAAVYLEERVA